LTTSLFAEGLRRAALQFLTGNKARSGELRAELLGWRHFGGFSAHNRVRVGAEDPAGRQKLAGYMLRAPMSLAKMSDDAATGTVIYRSKMHAGLKRNFQVLPGVYFLNAGFSGLVNGEEAYLHRLIDCVMFRVQPQEASASTGLMDFEFEPIVNVGSNSAASAAGSEVTPRPLL